MAGAAFFLYHQALAALKSTGRQGIIKENSKECGLPQKKEKKHGCLPNGY